MKSIKIYPRESLKTIRKSQRLCIQMIAVVSASVPARNAWQCAYNKYISKIPFHHAFFLDKKVK